jgi:hypothetical protein
MSVSDEYEYAAAFARLGRPLMEPDGVPEEDIARAERRLGHRVPAPVRAFYRVAGRARDFVGHYDDFLLPDDWSVDGTRLIFLAENQGVVLYAVGVEATGDAPVVMASNVEPFAWHTVCERASTFCLAMLHWEASFGGAMPAAGSGVVDEGFRSVLERECRPVGEVNAMWAYGREGLAACFVRWDDGWRVFLGALDEEALGEAADRFGIDLDQDG